MKKHRRSRAENTGPLSAGRIEYLEQARARVRARRLRRTALLGTLLTAVVLFATGLIGSSMALLKDWTDTARIALTPGPGWPQQTGVMEAEQVEPMEGGFVELGSEGCVVYSRSGSRLNLIQSGYARPALAAGKTRFVLYNRSGNELRVESRTQNLYTKTMENSIFLCAMSDNGTLSVVTEDTGSAAKLLVYSPVMEQQLSWSLTSAEGVPLRMKFSPDSRRLAVAAVTASDGQMRANLYVLPLAQGDPVCVGSQDGIPQWLGWLSNSTLLAVYDSRAVLYNAQGGELAEYDFAGRTLQSVSTDQDGNTALLLTSGQTCRLVTLDNELTVQYSGTVTTAHKTVRAGENVWLLTDDSVECLTEAGEYLWSQNLSVRPKALLANKKQVLVFCGNTVRTLTAP